MDLNSGEVELQLEVFTWRGQTRYRCPECTFDGPAIRDVVKHWQGIHRPAVSASGPLLFDAEGSPIQRSTEELYVPEQLQLRDQPRR